MGNSLQRNRFWWYRSLYDDYLLREFRYTFFIAAFMWLPAYWWGIHFNREIETMIAHKVYFKRWRPRRNRLTHSLLFEEFEVDLENWMKISREYDENPDKMKIKYNE